MSFFQAESSEKSPKAGKRLTLQGRDGLRKKKCQIHPYQIRLSLLHQKRFGMMDIIDHIEKSSGIDEAICGSTD